MRADRGRVAVAAAMVTLCTGAAASAADAPQRPQAVRRLVVSIPDRKLAVIENDAIVSVFAVAVGAPDSPTPVGTFTIVNRIANPTYYKPGTDAERSAGAADRALPTTRWIMRRSAVIARERPWPRDVRGRLRADDATVTAWLPGVTCRGSVDLSRLVCADARGEPWPIGIENTGIDAARNYFNTPEGLPLYAAALLAADAGAPWAAASTNGELLFLDDARRSAAAGTPADDVATLDSSCAGGARHLLVASATDADHQREALRAYRVTGRRLVAVTAPAFVAGRITALWSAPGAGVATTIAHDESAGRYEA